VRGAPSGLKSYWACLLLPVADMDYGEDLYIKMNSCGKPITPFEVFKADFEGALVPVLSYKLSVALLSDTIRRMETITLWRPTGPEELALVEASGWQTWPPRLPDQPIFYPVLNEEYATKIARDWNVKAGGVGYVTRFEVEKSFIDRYDVQQAGGRTILEYWIPAEDLEELNQHILGLIEVVAEYR
jgi:hypothetical protein